MDTLFDTTELEKAFLGDILVFKELLPEAIEKVKPEEFCNEKLKRVYEFMIETFKQHNAFDITLFVQWLKNHGKMCEIGHEGYLSDLAQKGLLTLFTAYIKGIKINALKRKQLQLVKLFEKDKDSQKLIDETSRLQTDIDILEKETGADLQKVSLDLIEEQERMPDIISTGFNGIDTNSAPARGDIMVIGAREQVGKSLLCINLIKHFLEQGQKVLIYTTEMKPEQYLKRQVSLYVQIPYKDLKYHTLSRENFSKVYKFLQDFSQKYKEQLIFSTVSHPNIDVIRQEMEAQRPDILIIDNLSGINFPYGNENKTDKIGRFANDLKDLILKHNCLGILVAHLNRESQATNSEPETRHIKDCSHLEEIASQVLLLWTEQKEDLSSSKKEIKWKLAKDRDGMGGRGSLFLNRFNLRITEDYV